MVNKQYQRGRRFEYKVKKLLEDNGFIVLRTSGSHGFADLVALRDNQVYFMQLKYGAKISAREYSKMYDIMVDTAVADNIHFMVVHSKPYKSISWMEIITSDYQEFYSGDWFE